MALRLTSTSLAAEQPLASQASSPQAVAAAVHALSGRASAALLARDLSAYRELFAQAATFAQEHRRYQARKLLLEAGLAAYGQLAPAAATEVLAAVAAAAIEVLEADPAEPVLLGYAGVAFYELWSLDAARALFLAAQRLDPALPHLRNNLSELQRRRRASGKQRRPLHGDLPALARRAAAVADRAQPATGLKLSLCMIVRDEEEMLPRCLAAVAPAVDEIVIVDTGSQDRTIEIARSFGARVIEREWTGSFADARNVSFDAATGDWILYLDADEVLVAEDAERLRALTGQTWREAFYLTETNFTGTEHDGTAVTHSALRVFRSRPEYRFSGRLHEQIAQHLPAYIPERIHHTGVRIEHYGYLGVVRDAKEKSRRNIELLLAQMRESAPTPFLHFNLGSEHFAAGDASAALAEFEKAWTLIEQEGGIDTTHEFTPSLIVRLVKALRVTGRTQDAIDRAEIGLRYFPGFTDLVFEQALAAHDLGRDEEAFARFEQCIELGDAPSRYTALVGCGTYLPRIAMAELHLRRRETAPALELLRWCAEHHPGFFGIVLPYATALLRADTAPEAVVAEIERRVPKVTPTVRFMLGTALFENGQAAPGEQQFRLVLDGQPHSGPARAALAEALLYQRRYRDAAEEAARMDADDPLALVAVRSELFGRLAADDLAGAERTLQQAVAAGMASGELAIFRGWLGLRTGAGAGRPLPPASMPLLELVLESLLRVQDFETFERVLPLVGGSELPVREQRELLGRIYLRRGYLKSAAREWMAVAQEAPDARALLGLARVAIGNGQRETAYTFAKEALALDPGSREAEAIASAFAPMPATAADTVPATAADTLPPTAADIASATAADTMPATAVTPAPATAV